MTLSPIDPSTFSELLTAARNGCTESAGVLLEQLREQLLKLARSQLPPSLRAKVGGSDLVQDSTLIAFNRIGEFRGHTRQELEAWLVAIYRSVRSAAIRAYREQQLRQVDREETLTEEVEDHASSARTQAEAGLRRLLLDEQLDAIRSGTSRLSERHQEVIKLRCSENANFAQVGAKMGISEDAARKLYGRAMRALIKEIREQRVRAGGEA